MDNSSLARHSPRGPNFSSFLVQGLQDFEIPDSLTGSITPAPIAEFQANHLRGNSVIIPFGGTGIDAIFALRKGKKVILTDISAEYIGIAKRNLHRFASGHTNNIEFAQIDCFRALDSFSGSFDSAILDPPWNVKVYRTLKEVPLRLFSPLLIIDLIISALKHCDECIVKCPHTIRLDDFDQFKKPFIEYRISYQSHPLLTLVHLGLEGAHRKVVFS